MAAIIDTCPSHNNHKKRISTVSKRGGTAQEPGEPNLRMALLE